MTSVRRVGKVPRRRSPPSVAGAGRSRHPARALRDLEERGQPRPEDGWPRSIPETWPRPSSTHGAAEGRREVVAMNAQLGAVGRSKGSSTTLARRLGSVRRHPSLSSRVGATRREATRITGATARGYDERRGRWLRSLRAELPGERRDGNRRCRRDKRQAARCCRAPKRAGSREVE